MSTLQVINGVEIIRGLDINEYHAAPHLSHTKLHYWNEGTPERWKAKFVDGKKIEEKEEDHFLIGRAVDVLLFEREQAFASAFTTSPSKYPSVSPVAKKDLATTMLAQPPEIELATAYGFDDDARSKFLSTPCTVTYKPWNMSSNYCQGWTAEQAAEGRSVLTVDQTRLVRSMALATAKNPRARDILTAPGREFQVSLRWQIGGIWFQARPDIVNFQEWSWDDLKSTRSMSAIGKNFWFLGYDMQAGLIYDAMRRIRGGEPSISRHIYVDKSFYPESKVVEIYGAKAGVSNMEYGLGRAIRAGKAIASARDTGIFARPQEEVYALDVPEWIQRKMTEGESLNHDEFLDADDEGEDVRLSI